MKKNLTELVFILDRSGSMSGLEADTIGGFNAMIEKQKKAPGEALISTILFDNVSEVIHDRVNVQDIRPMTDREYSVRGACACLLKDAADRNDNPNFVSHAEGEVRIIIIMVCPTGFEPAAFRVGVIRPSNRKALRRKGLVGVAQICGIL